MREGETADGALDRMIAEAQRERGEGRAQSVPRVAAGGLRRLELPASEPSGGDGVRGRDVVPRPTGLPQALETGAQQMVGAQQATGPLPGGGQGRAAPVVAGQFLWGAAQGVAGAVGTQLQALGDALRPGAQGHPGVFQSGLLLQGLPAGRPQGSDQGVGNRNGGQSRGGHSGSLLGPLAEPLPPVVEFNLPQDQLQSGCYTNSCHTTRARNGKPRNGDPGQSTRTRSGNPDDGDTEPRDPMAVPMVSPVPMQMVSPVPMQAWATGMSPAPAGCEPAGGNQVMMDPAARAVEIRQRVMQEAEEAFAREVGFRGQRKRLNHTSQLPVELELVPGLDRPWVFLSLWEGAVTAHLAEWEACRPRHLG